ncbi:aromatic ring-hydroxylating oxygenase subunit alpha [Amycolatopsis jejuensis]|uniref:aromatic ring-hydroxylating oxygenase subunit alpha n=1 Tax=Amycolatopsis jejuensis TaxID=330084 RepID=UPI0006909061|nr:aromatic ring-hydroxylating dioxygenase subunit alpha [Amycolatopsis jejuensis]
MTELPTSEPAVTEEVPYAITDPCYIPAERYFSPEFYQLEKERLWSRTWQMAARLEEIPEIGDFVEYRICDETVLVVRTGEHEVKAFVNACRHRATQLATGTGTFAAGEIVCPFHGWSWNLRGESSYIYGDHAFRADCMTPEKLRLRECKVDFWGGCVFINFDLAARPLADALEPMPSLLDPMSVEDMKVTWWRAIEVEANWKIALEAFMEGYHVMQTHPQLSFWMGRKFSSDFQTYHHEKNGHSWVQRSPQYRALMLAALAKSAAADGASAAEMTKTQRDQLRASNANLLDGLWAMVEQKDQDVLDAMGDVEVPAGQTFADLYGDAIYDYALEHNLPMRRPTPDVKLRWSGIFQLFPNTIILPQYGNAIQYRSRPLGPDRCIFELIGLTLKPDGEQAERAGLEGVFAADDEAAFGLVPRQDFGNIEAQQRGLRTRSHREQRLSDVYERGISNLHEQIDSYLATPL